jgi:hypothetical protein
MIHGIKRFAKVNEETTYVLVGFEKSSNVMKTKREGRRGATSWTESKLVAYIEWIESWP